MTVKEVMGAIHSKYPGIVTRGEYSPPTHRCSRWILLRGPFYRDTDYNCSILVDATQMYDWAVKHAKNVGHSDEQEEAAKDFFPEWVKNADPNDETVTLLDRSMQRALRNWDLDFVIFGWTRIWCPECQGFTETFERAQQEFQVTQDARKCISYLPEWNCEHGHILRKESDEPIRFF